MNEDPSITEEERDVDPIANSAIGSVVGAVAGGALGNSTAAAISPTEEDLYWQENHPAQEYARGDDGFTYEDYQPAYRLGWEGPNRYGTTFETANSAMRSDWEERRGDSRLAWEQAEPAVRAAWARAEARFS